MARTESEPLADQHLYRVADPTIPTLAGSFTRVRNGINNLVLDPEISFVDKLTALAATQGGESHQPYLTDPTVQRLCNIGKNPVMLNAAGILIVGTLDEYNPWDFYDASQEGQAANPDLLARFGTARRISDTVFWEHESYGQSSTRHTTAPNVEIVGSTVPPVVVVDTDQAALAISLPPKPYGSEHLLEKVDAFSRNIIVGTMAMHEKIAASSDEAKNKAALHAAVTNAFRTM